MKKIIYLLIFVFICTPTLSRAELVEQTFANNTVSVLIPSDFHRAADNLITTRYPDPAYRPAIVYTDDKQDALISINIAENAGDRQSIIHFFRDIKESLRNQHPSAKILQSDVIRNRTLAYVEVLMPNQDGAMLYTIMSFRYVGDKFFSLNFTVPADKKDQYQDTAREIAQNVKVIQYR